MISVRNKILKKVDSTFGATACSLLGRMECMTGPQCREKEIDSATLKRILVIRPGGIGDMLLLVPMLKLLAARLTKATIDILCEERNAGLAQMINPRGNVILYDRRTGRMLHNLRKARYNLTIDTEQFHNLSSVTALLSGAPLRIGFNIAPRRNPLYTHPVTYQPDGPEIQQFLKLLAPIGINTTDTINISGALCDLSLSPMKDDLNEMTPDSRVVVHTAATNRYKQWPRKRFRELINLLIENNKNPVVIVGQHASDFPFRDLKRERVIDCCGKLSLLQTAAVIKEAKIFIGCDTGLAHLAVALNTPSVTLFGSSDPRKWGHSSTKHTVIYHPMACAPCAIFGYHKPCREIQCMKAITTQQVFTACQQLLTG